MKNQLQEKKFKKLNSDNLSSNGNGNTSNFSKYTQSSVNNGNFTGNSNISYNNKNSFNVNYNSGNSTSNRIGNQNNSRDNSPFNNYNLNYKGNYYDSNNSRDMGNSSAVKNPIYSKNTSNISSGNILANNTNNTNVNIQPPNKIKQ